MLAPLLGAWARADRAAGPVVPHGLDHLGHRRREPHLGGNRRHHPAEVLRRHTNHGEQLPVHAELPAEHGAIASKAPLPEAIRQDGHREPVPCGILFGGEGAAEHGAHAEDGEVPLGHQLTEDEVRRAVDRGVAEEIRVPRQPRQRGYLPLVVDEVGDRRRLVLGRRGLVSVDVHQLLRAIDGERAVEDRVDDAEDGAVDPDAERQGENRDDGEARRAAEAAKGVAGVLEERLHASTRSVQEGVAERVANVALRDRPNASFNDVRQRRQGPPPPTSYTTEMTTAPRFAPPSA